MAEILRSACLLWVNRVGFAMFALRLLHPQHQTFVYAAYYNQARTHLALDKNAPLGRAVRRFPY